jgi:hypothetical protein
MAVGQYTDTSRRDKLMAAIETNGAWSRAVELPAPLGAYPTGDGLYQPAISCPSAGKCIVESAYMGISQKNGDQVMVVGDSDGSWGRAQTLPSRRNYNDDLDSISCPSLGNCVAVGFYNGLGAEATETNGVWSQPVVVARPVGSGFNAVSCTSASYCVAVGNYLHYYPLSVKQYAMEATKTRGAWGKGLMLATPRHSPAGELSPTLWSVSYISLGNCVAVGDLTAQGTEGFGGPFSASEIKGQWYRGIAVPLPVDAEKWTQTLILHPRWSTEV